ncbi:hypothetical protein BGZ67_002791 [Mortierella alpina]|nr:hypothetical protein BGZ67_002791 [Mortierella alpina]
MPGLPQPIPHRRRPQRQNDEPSFKPDPSRVIINDRAWTPDEKRALYLAATQSRLPHQWSKIRGMTNLHRSDQEIETEYQKLFGHRTNGPADEDEDEDEHKERDCLARQYYRGGYRPEGMDRDTDGDADDENERARFKGYYGGEPRLVPRHGPPEPIRVPHFQLEKIPLRI